MALATETSGSFRVSLQNPEAERALLGGMLLDNRRIPEILDQIPPQARPAAPAAQSKSRRLPSQGEPLFSNSANQEIFGVIHGLFERDRGVDLTTLGHELDIRGRYDAVGGTAYLASLEEAVVSTIYLPEYARIVIEQWRRRSLLRAAEAIASDALKGEDEIDAVLDRSEQRIFDLAQEMESRDFVHIADVAADVMNEIEARAKQDRQGLTGLATGFSKLDEMTTGFRPGNLIILAARPSVGKSAFAMNIAGHAAVKLGRPVGVFSLEMSSAELNQRLLCTMAGVPLGRIRGNRLSRQDRDRLHNETMRLETTPLYIDDSSNLSPLELRTRARRLKAKCPELGLIVVDYLQLMHVPGSRVENRQQEVATISRALKSLARDLEVPVLALSQLSRQSEQRSGRATKDRLPKLSDLRESGAIEQDADLVIFVHREFKAKGEEAATTGPQEPELATIRIGKQRNGPIGDFPLLFRGELTQFVDVHPGAQTPGRG